MIYRYIYKITCTTGRFKNKFYYGQHTTENLDDGYKGSGNLLRDYYKKHPNDYIKEIISFHNSVEELNKAEYDIILPWLGNKNCLNLHRGGNKAYFKLSEEHKRKISLNGKGKKHGSFSEEHKRKLRLAKQNYIPINKGKTGEFKWMTDNHIELFLHSKYWGEYIDIGFKYGRKYKRKK